VQEGDPSPGDPLPARVEHPVAAWEDNTLFSAMVESFKVVVQAAGATPHPVLPRVREMIGNAESLRLFAQTRSMSGNEVAKTKQVLLVETDRRLLLLTNAASVIEEHELSSVEPVEFRDDFLWGSKMTLRASGQDRLFTQVLPYYEGERLLSHLRGDNERSAAGMPVVPMSPPIAHFHNMTLYEDRLAAFENDQLYQWPMSDEVTATVDTAGNIAATRGRRLGVKAGATLLLGPLGLLAGGPRDYVTDTRELYLLVEGPDWAYSAEAPPDWGLAARRFAQLVHVLSRIRAQAQPPPEPSAEDQAGTLTQLKMLGELRDTGVLTPEEFAEQKARILRQE
jgi:Short C-terminal domain